MALKSLQDWTLERQFRSVPGVVDVASFGGTTREYQVIVDPEKLIAYGLTLQQVQQQLAANNTNAGGSFIEQGEQQINVREVGLFTDVNDISQTVLKAANGTALRVSDIARVVQGPKIRLGQIGKTLPRQGRQAHRRRRRSRRRRPPPQGRQLRRNPRRHPRQGQGTQRPRILPKGVTDRSLPRPFQPPRPHHPHRP